MKSLTIPIHRAVQVTFLKVCSVLSGMNDDVDDEEDLSIKLDEIPSALTNVVEAASTALKSASSTATKEEKEIR